jgi:FixJ family two-component response regulator
MELMAQIPGHVQLIIICCGLNDHRRMIDALELGAYDVLFPPYEREEIQRIVEAAAAKSERRARHHAELRKFDTLWSTPYESAATSQ